MQTEFEATFISIEPDELKKKLVEQGYICIKPLYTQIRTTFHFPVGHEKEGAFVRVRDEGNRTTMTIKQFVRDGDMDSQKECELIIDDYDIGVQFLKTLGCVEKAIQETRREIWKKDDIYIMIDERPFLDPIVEIEGRNEAGVHNASVDLGYNREEAIFDSITEVYAHTYDISHDRINNHTPIIRFDMENPFL